MSQSDTLEAMSGVLYKVLRRLADLQPEFNILQSSILLLIASKPGITQRQVQVELGKKEHSVISRNLAILSKDGDRKRAGLDLIEIDFHHTDRRERALTLTPKARRLLHDILNDLQAVPRK
jgi:DNA-binding MarR family transcriptional regulator